MTPAVPIINTKTTIGYIGKTTISMSFPHYWTWPPPNIVESHRFLTLGLVYAQLYVGAVLQFDTNNMNNLSNDSNLVYRKCQRYVVRGIDGNSIHGICT